MKVDRALVVVEDDVAVNYSVEELFLNGLKSVIARRRRKSPGSISALRAIHRRWPRRSIVS